MKRLLSWIEKHEAIILILCLVAILRVPSLFEPAWYADEDIYLTIGQNLRRGLVLYKDIYDNKTPLIYALAGLAGNVGLFRLLLMFWHLANVFFFYQLAGKLLRNQKMATGVTILFSILTTIPLLEGQIANGEIFMILPTTIAINLLIEAGGEVTEKRMRFFLSGIFFALAFLFKTPPLFEMAGLVFFLLFWRKTALQNIAVLVIGFALPVAASFGYFSLIGGGQEYIAAAFAKNLPYLSSWGGGGGGGALSGGLATRGVILLTILAGLLFWRKKLGKTSALICIWFAFALFGSLLSGRPYPHYLLQIIPAGSLLAGLIIYGKQEEIRVVSMGLLFLLAVALVRYQFWHYQTVAYYQNFGEYALGRKTKEEYFRYFGPGVVDNLRAASFIRKATKKEDEIFVWGTEPAIYWLSDRKPATKYTVAYHIIEAQALEEAVEILARVKPKAIVVVRNERSFPRLAGLVSEKYAIAGRFGNLEVYLRLL